jgi:hypothetical protein
MASEVDPAHPDCDPDSDTYRDGHRHLHRLGHRHLHRLGHCYLNADVSGYRIRQTARQRKAVSYKKASSSSHREESGKTEVNQRIGNVDASRDRHTEGVRNYTADLFDYGHPDCHDRHYARNSEHSDRDDESGPYRNRDSYADDERGSHRHPHGYSHDERSRYRHRHGRADDE